MPSDFLKKLRRRAAKAWPICRVIFTVQTMQNITQPFALILIGGADY